MFVRQKFRVSHSVTPMSTVSVDCDSSLPAQILFKTLKWQEDVLVPEKFSTDEILDLKKWMRLNEPVDYSAWNGQPTLRVTGCVFYCHLKTYCGPSSEIIQSPE